MKSLSAITASLLALLCAVGIAEPREPSAQSLSQQLAQMAQEYHFDVIDRAKLTEVPARPVAGDLIERISLLLADFNHVLIRSTRGEVERVIVLGLKQAVPPVPDEIVIPMQRKGSHHLVQATLVGTKGAEIRIDLIIDTGSSFLVLPRSMSARLLIPKDQLQQREVQTAKGLLWASVGRLPSIRIGGENIADVEVAFIEDAKLGGNALLGMSLLSRYKMILDDRTSTLTLILQE